MMKKSKRALDFKEILIIFLSILGTLIVAASLVVGFISFNGDSTTSNNNIIELSENSIGLMTESEQKQLQKDVADILKKDGVQIASSKILESEGVGTKIQYVSTTAYDKLKLTCDRLSVLQEIKDLAIFNNKTVDPVLSAHTKMYMPYFEHIWRAAVAIGVGLVVWFVYMTIRYRLSMSITAIIMLILDGFAMLSVVALCRIPVGISLMGSLTVTLLFSVLCSTLLFASMYKNFKKADWQNKSLLDATNQTVVQNKRLILLFAAILGILLGGIALFSGFFITVAADLFGFALSTFLGIAIVCTNTLFLTPAIFYSIQNSFDTAKVKKGKNVFLAGKEMTLKQENKIS